MRVRDLKAETEYATCEGSLVIPVEPVHANWFYIYDPNAKRWELVDGGDTPKVSQDPWGACHQPANRSLDSNVRRTKPGVLVDVYDHDRLGSRITPPRERTIIPARDIAGTWVTYLALYADVVAARVDEARRQQDREVAIEEIKHRVAMDHGVTPEDVRLESPHRFHDDEEPHIRVRISFELPIPGSYGGAAGEDPYVAVAASMEGMREWKT